LQEPSRLFVFVRFPDDRRFALVIRSGVVVFVLVIIIIVIVGISRRHRVPSDGDESPLGRGKVLRDALGHVGLLAGMFRANAHDTTADRLQSSAEVGFLHPSESMVFRFFTFDPVL
jgi:hypothetical protein